MLAVALSLWEALFLLSIPGAFVGFAILKSTNPNRRGLRLMARALVCCGLGAIGTILVVWISIILKLV